MLEFTHHQDKPFLRLLLLYDDDQREFDYTTGAERALETADNKGVTVISMKTIEPPSSDAGAILERIGRDSRDDAG